MGATDPKTPVRADHRFIKRVLSTMKGQVVEIPGEFSRVSRVFSKAGGSWERLFLGSAEDVELLRKVIKVAHKRGHLTKKRSWTGKHG